jgi:hypothetical protein
MNQAMTLPKKAMLLPDDVFRIVKEYLIMPTDMFKKAYGFKLHLRAEPIDVLVFFINVYLQIPTIIIPKIIDTSYRNNDNPLQITKRTIHTENSITYTLKQFSTNTIYTLNYRRKKIYQLINKHFNVRDLSVMNRFMLQAHLYFTKILYVNTYGVQGRYSKMEISAFSWVNNYAVGDVIIHYVPDTDGEGYYQKALVVAHRKYGLILNEYTPLGLEVLDAIEVLPNDRIRHNVIYRFGHNVIRDDYGTPYNYMLKTTDMKHIVHHGDTNIYLTTQTFFNLN